MIALVYMKTIQKLVNIFIPPIINICSLLSTKIYAYIVSIENKSGGVQITLGIRKYNYAMSENLTCSM